MWTVACFKSWNKSSQTIYSRRHIFVTHSPKSGPGFPHIIAFFYVQRVAVKGNCLFCGYRWNCWPSTIWEM